MIVKNNITGEITEIEDIAGEPIETTAEQKEHLYKDTVVAHIRQQYTSDDEQAILRKKLAGIDNGEFDIFNTYAEECKIRAKSEIKASDYVN